MTRQLFAIAMFFMPVLAAAQVTVNIQLPPAGMIQKEQLWNLVVVNNNAEIPEASILLDIQDAITGQTILSAASRTFSMGKGIKLVNVRDVQPVQYNYVATELSGPFIPLGTYVACYRVMKHGPKGFEPLGDECVKVNINPLSPPLLTTPFDRAVLQTPYPQFSWLPPTPSDMFSSLSYDISVAEVLEGQTPAEAMLFNTPVYTNHYLRMPYESYPSTFSTLKPGKQYAWQVVARNGLNYAAQTEVWSFVVQPPDSAAAQLPGGGYVLMKNNKENTGISYISGEELKIKYYSFDREHESVVRIRTADGKEVQALKQKLQYGDNFLHFRLNNQYRQGDVYLVEITDQQQTKHSVRFSIK